jgi:TolB-like protein
MLYEMAAGRRPFQGQTGFDLSSAILNQPPPPLSASVPAEVGATITRCLDKEPGRRYQHAGEVRAALDAIRAGTMAPWAAWRYRLGRRPSLLMACGVVVLVAVLAGLSASRLRDLFWPGPRPGSHTTLAVLPLRILTGKEEISYLGIGITDAIITQLANIGQLRVRPTSSILKYQEQVADVQEVGKTLNAENILSGTVQQVGGKLRISMLIRVAIGSLWGHHYDLAQQDSLSLQDFIADRVTAALKVQVRLPSASASYRRYTQNAKAYDFTCVGGRVSLTGHMLKRS